MAVIINIVFVLSFLIATVACGLQFTLRLNNRIALPPVEWLLTGFGVGALGLAFIIWAIGLFSYSPISMWLICGFWSVGAIFSIYDLQEKLKVVFRDWQKPEIHWLGWVAISAIVVTTLFAGLAPPADYDGLNYHLLLPRRDLEFGRILTIPNDRVFDAFPALAEMHFRLALATVGDRSAQMIHGLFGLAASVSTYALVRRLSGSTTSGLLAAVMFLAIKIVAWEAGTTHNELYLAFYFTVALLLYLAWREIGGTRLIVLAGIVIGALCHVKYHGIVLAVTLIPVMAYDVVKNNRRAIEPILGICTSILVFSPLLIRNTLFFGNPVAPLFGRYFTSSDPATQMEFRQSDDNFLEALVNFVLSPVDMFIFGGVGYDGHVFGAPYIFIFAPLIIFFWRRLRNQWPIFSVLAIYYVLWFVLMFRVSRFLIPIFPILAAYAGMSALWFWNAVQGQFFLRSTALCLFAILSVNQLMFIGVYSGLRMAPASGLIKEETYLMSTPSQNTTYLPACRFIEKHLGSGQLYLSIGTMRSYYCPQSTAIFDLFDDEREKWRRRPRPFPKMSAKELSKRINSEGIALVFVASSMRQWSPDEKVWTISAPNLLSHRFWPTLAPALDGIKPVFQSRDARVFDAKEVSARLASLPGEK